jgi:drug/metabolite transporter (DMT)-like permease
LQHLVAGTVPPDLSRAIAVLRHLVRRPPWLMATCISFLAMVCHAWALRLGSIALVQPLMLIGVVLAVPLRAAMERRRPPWAAVRAVGFTVVGLAVFLSFADLQRGTTAPRVPMAVCLVVLGGAAATAISRCGARRLAPQARAALLGVTAGVLFGLTAGLLKLLGSVLGSGARSAESVMIIVGSLILVGLMGTAVNQRAYQIAPIAFSMPLVNVVDIMVALLFGALVFGELPGHSMTGVVLQAMALGCVAWGLRGIARLKVDDRPCGRLTVQGATP